MIRAYKGYEIADHIEHIPSTSPCAKMFGRSGLVKRKGYKIVGHKRVYDSVKDAREGVEQLLAGWGR